MKTIDLTTGQVQRVIVALALPLVGSSLLQFTYSLVDMFWVGALGSDAVASIGAASFYIMLGQAIQSLIVVGAGIKVSQAVGRRDQALIQRYIRAGRRMNLGLGLLFAVLLAGFGQTLIGFLNMDAPPVERLAYSYLLVSAPMLVFSFANLFYARLFSAYGNTTTAMRINATGVTLNMILSPLFIYPLGLGVVGAGLATLVANVVMFGFFWHRARLLFDWEETVEPNRTDYTEILRLGFPMATQRVLFTVISIFLARMIGSYGTEAIAAQRIGLQIESIAYMMIGGLNGAIASYTGQNLGARKVDRVHEGYRVTTRLGILYTGLITLVFLFVPDVLIGLFVDDPTTIDIGASYLRIIGISLIFASFEMIGNGYFSGLGLPKIPATISIVFTVARIPLALALEPYLGLDAIWWSIAISSIIKGLVSVLYVRLMKKEVTSLAEAI
ncbi:MULTISPECIES: MATE family efflux transporter [Exiguobacterium]|uniref:MATE family efflux transporter n=1 Tax=Exiguobacterium TaxID=33986 RepID=UPI000497FB8E|nr:MULTISPECIES: MATE family efflux transporter [Exiguobacterium]TCI71473.1 MATE family efflux transporter [Exiguobacterium sp. IPCI3]TCI81451.1 MATE family efflux transporter [Exiguobacterium sp. IPCH1]TCI82648.1 MATE family efflux transporter [Exiguobacterium sp. IPBC4]